MLLLNFVFIKLITSSNDIIKNEYIISYSNNSSNLTDSPSNHIKSILQSTGSSENQVLFDYSSLDSMTIKANPSVIKQIHMLPFVNYVTHNHAMYLYDVQKNATWGISRVGQRNKIETQPSDYYYSPNSGKDVNVYVVDTGIYTDHPDFEGRAKWGAVFVPEPKIDSNGHGTHCAGTIGSKTWGVAKKVNLIAVKVMNAAGTGTNASVLAGIDWVIKNKSGKLGNVISMSIGGDAAQPIDDAVERAHKAGIIVVAAAGNDNKDACEHSPARAPNAITVAASDIEDKKASFSNFGKCIDIIAPGVKIVSTSNKIIEESQVLSGTSMACPHVAGIAATLLSQNVPISGIDKKIKDISTKNAITGFDDTTVNFLAYNNY